MSPLPARPEANAESDFRVVQKWSLGDPNVRYCGIPVYPIINHIHRNPLVGLLLHIICVIMYIYIHTYVLYICVIHTYIYIYMYMYTPVFGMMFITTPHSWLVYGMVCSGVTTL